MAPPVSGSAPRTVKLPTPREVAENHVAKQEAEAKAPPRQPADSFQDGPAGAKDLRARKGIQNVEGKLSPKATWPELPEKLSKKIAPEVWNALDEGQRGTLIASYKEFEKAGMWDHITQVVGEKEAREKPVKLPGGYQTQVHGNSGAIQYKVRDPVAFTNELIKHNPNFGVDGSFMAKMHPGQTSIRESTQPQPIHISVGPGNLMDAHIDHVNPVSTPKNGQTVMDLKRGVQHWREELLPELIRKHTGLPGVNLKPSLEVDSRGIEVSGTINLEFHGLEKQKPPKLQTHSNGEYDVPADAVKSYESKLDGLKLKFPQPLDVDAKAMAKDVAVKLADAKRRGDNTVRVDLPELAHLKGKQGPAVTEVHRLAAMVKQELVAAGLDVGDVSRLTVTFGKTNAKNAHATEGMTVGL
ncbi:MAG: hypothetical protein JNK82_45280 [Myxococcaceae bacterium]|nr:hypothetical protein [Myxococcaceae bacterium]